MRILIKIEMLTERLRRSTVALSSRAPPSSGRSKFKEIRRPDGRSSLQVSVSKTSVLGSKPDVNLAEIKERVRRHSQKRSHILHILGSLCRQRPDPLAVKSPYLVRDPLCVSKGRSKSVCKKPQRLNKSLAGGSSPRERKLSFPAGPSGVSASRNSEVSPIATTRTKERTLRGRVERQLVRLNRRSKLQREKEHRLEVAEGLERYSKTIALSRPRSVCSLAICSTWRATTEKKRPARLGRIPKLPDVRGQMGKIRQILVSPPGKNA